ncbi:MAE_28990/MAE_18760 family HEPN-like nuclease [Vibrio sp. HS-50-1]|uniref:MAE_28990/MAE_18760 family HEPN-like nuclease n=1 Tax=Vibrio sp. HS-50-1 TaxID=2945079 RepID=UPI00215F5D74|nr:MAE_28990/MAE_18760 family HEPN-like nuclease [Vibrio sp. HS-50-1]MCS0202872.1 MAE_28990/MAE_18760 family HEPN-like nuclease [Vibrio sp. HS-50-1]
MKVRSLGELEDLLDKDLAWRRKEFTTLKLMVGASRKHEKTILMRASVAMLYAHWEGHIKFCAQVYLLYLKHVAPSYKQMTDNFVQMSLSEKFKQGFSIKRFSSQQEVFNYLTQERDEKFDVDESVVIDTESNLKYEVVFNILGQLGLDTSIYELKEHFINSKLLKCRNAIAHGERLNDLELEDAHSELETELLTMIETFQNLVRNAAENKLYLKKAS